MNKTSEMNEKFLKEVNYGYTQQEILNSHVIFLKDDPFFKVSIDQLNYADDTRI